MEEAVARVEGIRKEKQEMEQREIHDGFRWIQDVFRLYSGGVFRWILKILSDYVVWREVVSTLTVQS